MNTLIINKEDTVDIIKISVPGYDGHCLRAYAYFGDQMPDIKQVDESTSCYKVEMDDGTVKYLTQEELDKLQNT